MKVAVLTAALQVFIAFRRSLLSPPYTGTNAPCFWTSLHCLSAFTAFPAGRTTAIPVLRFASSLPFGVHCFPRRTVGEVEVFPTSRSSLPFGVHCFPRWGGVRDRCSNPLPVFIAFRRSLLSPRCLCLLILAGLLVSSLPFGVHCFPRMESHGLDIGDYIKSSLSFGVHCFPRSSTSGVKATGKSQSSLPFGVHCFPRKTY